MWTFRMLEVVNDLPQPSIGHLKGFSPVEEEAVMTQALLSAATVVTCALTSSALLNVKLHLKTRLFSAYLCESLCASEGLQMF